MGTYACSDLHGMYDLYVQIKDFIKPEDTIICLGDCADRGPDGWKIIEAVAQDSQWIYLRGNHEDMLAKAINSYYENDYSEEYALLCYNGGSKTYEDWGKYSNYDKQWGSYLLSLPCHYEYTNKYNQLVLLSHSGYNPVPEDKRSKSYTDRDFIWDRNHMNTKIWLGGQEIYMVHGHTPVALAHKGRSRPELLRAENYCEGHKFNIDMASWYTGVACLINLDTFEEFYFYTEPLKN